MHLSQALQAFFGPFDNVEFGEDDLELGLIDLHEGSIVALVRFI